LAVQLRPVEQVPGAYVVDGVLTPAECAQLIAAAEAVGFAPKKSRRPGPPVRNNARALYTPSAELSAALEARLRPLLETVDVSVIGARWRLPERDFLNTKWRMNRYDAGEGFDPHFDTGHAFPDGSRTLLSVIAYLNDDFQGGETTFIDVDTNARVAVTPKAGSVLVFHHYGPRSPMHDTAALVGRKYVARTDVRFQGGAESLERLLFQTPSAVQKAVLLLGVPGAGKSTVAAALARRHGLGAVNFGAGVRALGGSSSPLARALEAARAAPPPPGTPRTRWLPDGLSAQVFATQLPPPGNELLLLDGYPRRRSQSTQLETDAWALLAVVHLKVSPETQAARLAHRAQHERVTADLDVRMADWERDTAPLLEHYRKRGLLEEVDGELPQAEVCAALEQVLEARQFDLLYAYVPSTARAWLEGFTPTKVNLSKKYRVYRFARGAEERFLKVVYEPSARNPSSYEGPILATVKEEGLPFDTPVVLAYFELEPEVNGVISARVPGITLKLALQREALHPRALVAQWARALATIHGFVPRRPERFLTRTVGELVALAHARRAAHVLRPAAFSAKYGIDGPIDLDRELAEVEALCQATRFDQVRLTHGDPCAPNFIWSPEKEDITGCVDLSGIGFADVHWDLSIACWSVNHNTSPGLSDTFLAEYRAALTARGAPLDIDDEKLALMYRLARFLL
jgi:aminoglycoside phosphotransferase/adenylate kinase family enzyme/predicted 2-oxoglutarate/Fe(II)-dependent dioxygenase YbiX